MCMTRTNMDIDDEILAQAMEKFDIGTTKEAVDLALHRLVGMPLTKDALLTLRGAGRGGALASTRDESDRWASA